MPISYDPRGLMKFFGRPEWTACFQSIFDRHFGPALDPVGMTFEDLGDELGDAMAMTLWECAFEDFLTRDFDVAGVNIIDEYLKRRGKPSLPGMGRPKLRPLAPCGRGTRERGVLKLDDARQRSGSIGDLYAHRALFGPRSYACA
ncbi:hypothetical protein [Pleomorphomonas carboxyditropha]|uniref:Uncharacterized protein n=1 Tax=Pleomorphomonas carboxyditropha TaxID=2023338 RepID=A0A2G9WPS5_9HYPH|nr:hypothetical protein [Pleomorphomonas carboxyditropha]PIO96312.1 hypothetical protein CJ014_26115 [Pleomorphomonas carboxyditropha]